MTGVIIATSMEAAPLLAMAGIVGGADGDSPVIHDLGTAAGLTVCVCGMGPERARSGLDMLLDRCRANVVVNVGVAGTVGAGIEVGSVLKITSVCLWPRVETFYACRVDRWPDLPPAILATVDSPVFDPVLRNDIARHADLVDMECAAVAQGCHARGVPLYSIKGVTDQAGGNDRKRLLANLDRVSAALASLVWRELVQ